MSEALTARTQDTTVQTDAVPLRRRIPVGAILAFGAQVVCDAGAVVAILLGLVLPTAALTLAAVLVLTVLLVPPVPGRLIRGLGPTGRGVLPRAALAVVAVGPRPTALLWSGVAVLCVSIALEPLASRLARAAIPVAANLRGFRARNAGPFGRDRLFVVDTTALLVVAGAAAAGLAAAGVVAAAAAGAALAAVLVFCADAGIRIRARRNADPALVEALTAHAPQFAVHWDATPGTAYQLSMWLPHLERIGVPFMIVLRNAATFAEVAALTTAPVIVRRDPGDIDAVAVPSLTTVFYVNNAARNTHFVRFTGLEHVQLGHGDSDKAPSYSPVHRLYTRVFVSGRAAIDRFARNGVSVPEELFTVVGRPQVAGMLVGRSTSKRPTALYAPTWAGANADSDHCSLPIGVEIVETLLEHGYRVLYRPHPYTRRDAALAEQSDRVDALLARDAQRSGRVHLDSARTAETDLHACFDAADLLVSDVSSVASDFLHSEKPFLLTAIAEDPATLLQESALAAGAYLVAADGTGLREGVEAAGAGDPRLAERRAVKAHVLGDHGSADPHEVFVQHARDIVLGARARVLQD